MSEFGAAGKMRALEDLGRQRLSQNFFMREFLFSEIAAVHGFANVPDDPALAIAAGSRLCETLLEPLHETFGRVAVRSAYRSPEVNGFGNEHGLNCASNDKNYAHHIWDRRDDQGRMGATACIVLPRFADLYAKGMSWTALAWWIHDHLDYSTLYFFPKLAAFNIQWREDPERRIDSYVSPRGNLTKQGKPNWDGRHDAEYAELLEAIGQ